MEKLVLKSKTWTIILSNDFIGAPYLQKRVKNALEQVLSSSMVSPIVIKKAFLSFTDQYILWKGYYNSRCSKKFDFPSDSIFEKGIAIEVEDGDVWEREFKKHGRGFWNRTGDSFYYNGYDVANIIPSQILTFQQLYNAANQFTPINETSSLDLDTLVALDQSNSNGLESSIDPSKFWQPFSKISVDSANKLTLYLGIFVPMAFIGVMFGSVLVFNKKTLWTRDDMEHWKDKHYNDIKRPKPLKKLTRYVDNHEDRLSEETVFNYIEVKKNSNK